MIPAARVQTAIECLDQVVAGEPAERVLTAWSRRARHAGSGDRAAVRDLVFGVLRRWWSSAAMGGGEDGRARMIGFLRSTGVDPKTLFTGARYAPVPLSDEERTEPPAPDRLVGLDCPDWLAPRLKASLGSSFEAVMSALQDRAPVFLRVNIARTDVQTVRDMLAREDIETRPAPLSPTALEVVTNARRVQTTSAYRDGLVELQDAASQAVVDMLPLDGVARILDYCAGGGGKSLALAARTSAQIDAHDAEPHRLADLPTRSARAGARIRVVPPQDLEPDALYDLVLVDAPCSGSGAWRRSPEGKIRFTPERLTELVALQDRILRQALRHVAPGGVLAYATCSMLSAENQERVDALAAQGQVSVVTTRQFTPLDGGDGFYCAVMRHDPDSR